MPKVKNRTSAPGLAPSALPHAPEPHPGGGAAGGSLEGVVSTPQAANDSANVIPVNPLRALQLMSSPRRLKARPPDDHRRFAACRCRFQAEPTMVQFSAAVGTIAIVTIASRIPTP
jgi:hypothetical protein